jgi:predicted nucleotidyltransferase component of viral defense system
LFGLSKTTLKMALKGGTGIRKVYIGNYRFSDDLDFTLLEGYDSDVINAF